MKSKFLAITILLLFSLGINVYSHPGRTDSNGGHMDTNNESGLGSYHYHCGENPAHLHNNGVCPYSSNSVKPIPFTTPFRCIRSNPSLLKGTPTPTPTPTPIISASEGIPSIMVSQTLVPDQSISILVNEKILQLDVPPVIVQGRVLVPLRAIFESLSAEVDWDSDAKTVTGRKGNTVVKLKINDKYATINDKVRELDVPAVIVNGRTLVPIRFIAESLGASVLWDGDKRLVKVDL